MPIRLCKICSKELYVKPSHLKLGYGKYCSNKCRHEGKKKGKVIVCFLCRKEVYKSQQSLKRSKSKKYFCGKSCQTKWRNALYIGKKHSNYTYGLGSYRSVLIRNNTPRICNLCKTKDIRILAVHHIDNHRHNNKAKNLAWLCYNCHFLVHHDKVEEARFLAKLN